MFSQSMNVARKFGAKLAVVPALALPVLASAQSTPVSDITDKVDEAMTGGLAIAGAVVVGLFAIWAVKLLWRAK